MHTVGASEGSFVVVEHALEDGDNAFVAHADVDEEVHNPGGWPDIALELVCVFLDHRDEDERWEGGF